MLTSGWWTGVIVDQVGCNLEIQLHLYEIMHLWDARYEMHFAFGDSQCQNIESPSLFMRIHMEVTNDLSDLDASSASRMQEYNLHLPVYSWAWT